MVGLTATINGVPLKFTVGPTGCCFILPEFFQFNPENNKCIFLQKSNLIKFDQNHVFDQI